MKTKLLFVIHNLKSGGVPSSLSSLYDHINKKYDVSVFALSLEGHKAHSYIDAVIPEYTLSRLYFSKVRALKGLEKPLGAICGLLRKTNSLFDFGLESFVYKKTANYLSSHYDFDVIISFQDKITAKLCQYFNNKSIIAWIHCDYPKIMGKLEDEAMFQKYDEIVCVSDYTANNFKKFYKSVSEKVSFIYNIVDYDRIIKKSYAQIDNSFFRNNTFIIVSIGRLSHLKRFYLIPEIASSLKENGCKFIWYIIGGGDKNEENLIIDNIEKYRVANYVILLGNQQNPYPFLRHSNLLVSLSETEACPMIFIEARTLGVPIVSANFGSSYEFISDDIDGIIRPVEDIDNAIIKIIKDTKYYNRLKNNSNKLYIDNNIVLRKFDEMINR